MADLARSARVLLEGADEPTARVDFEAACALLSGMDLDLDGGRRVLAVAAVLVPRARREPERFGPLLDLAHGVEARMCALALARGLRDPHPRPRAAALEACTRLFGAPFLAAALDAIALDVPPPAEPRVRAFGLGEQPPFDDVVHLRVLALVAEHGLPVHASEPTAARRERLKLLHALTRIATDYTLYTDRSRVAAMGALSQVSGAGIESLRLEDWQAWWEGWAEGELEAVRSLEAAQEDAPRP